MAKLRFYDALGNGATVRSGSFLSTDTGTGPSLVADDGITSTVIDADTTMFTVSYNAGSLWAYIFVDDLGDPNVFSIGSIYYYDGAGNDLIDLNQLDLRFDIRDDFSAGFQFSNMFATDDVFIGNRFADYIEAGLGNDTAFGSLGNDTLLGQDGTDSLSGGMGQDVLAGGTGADRLSGGMGRDFMSGAAGADSFVFTTMADMATTGAAADIITDFTRGADKIVLTDIDASTLIAGNNAFTFVGTAAFSTLASGEVRFARFDLAGTTNDYTLVYLDTDRDTAAEAVIRLTGLQNLTAGDFAL